MCTFECQNRARAQKGVTGLVPSAVGAWAAVVTLRRAAVQRAGGHPMHHALADARRAVRGDHQGLLRSFLGNVIARGICKLVEGQLLTNNVCREERLQPVARSGRPVVTPCRSGSTGRIISAAGWACAI